MSLYRMRNKDPYDPIPNPLSFYVGCHFLKNETFLESQKNLRNFSVVEFFIVNVQ